MKTAVTTQTNLTSILEPQIPANALAVIKKRYLRQDSEGRPIETPAEMFYRVASFMASADVKWDEAADVAGTTRKFYEMLARFDFLPGGRCLFEAGNNHTHQMSSCFVVPIPDEMAGIFESLKNAAIIQQKNGGTGFNFSAIRPRGDSVKGVPGVAAGPIHYLRTFDTSLSRVLQGSKRHGGNMGILNVNHPDIEEFIELKDRGSDIKNFNISVGVTRDFMEKVRNDEEYELINPRTKQPVKKLRAREIFNRITKRAWECADPGMIFLDAVADGNNNDHLGDMVATNPCGEQPLLPYESCNLGSIVLSNHVKDKQIDWVKLSQTAKTAAHFMDNMIELNTYPLPVVDEKVKLTRKIGVGVMGFAEMLYKIGVPYNSETAVELVEKCMKTIYEGLFEQSVEMAKTRGVFPAWEGSRWQKRGIQIRNSHLTSIAPTGTISMAANTSSGIEPVFNLVTIRKVFFEDNGNNGGGETMTVVDEVFAAAAKERGVYSEELMQSVAEKGTLKDLVAVPDDLKSVFVTAHDVSADWHVRIQAAAQKYTDAAVSKTINFNREATVDEVRQAYVMAYELGCKGVTIYRDGSKENQVLNLKGQSGAQSKSAAATLDCEPVIAPGVKVEIKSTAAIEAPAGLTPNGLMVLEKRALKKDDHGCVLETPDELFRRVAKYVAAAETAYGLDEAAVQEIEEDFYRILSGLEFVSGQALRNADSHFTLSACLVLPIEDKIESIMQTSYENVLAHKATCGTGFNFSALRPKGDEVGEAGPIAAGPVAFMKAIAASQKTVWTKGGRSQGSMGILNVDHPDIREFVEVKDDDEALVNMNISIGATDEFMTAVKNGATYAQRNPRTGETVKEVAARELFTDVAEHAWKSGDPGVIFVDRIEHDNPTPTLGKLNATNPCGEQPLVPYETCNLGSVVLSRMVKTMNGTTVIDWDKLARVVKLAVRFMDNTIDVNIYPFAKIEEMSKKTRRIGVGVMGFADLLVLLGVGYNTEEAVKLAEEIMFFVQQTAHEASEELGELKGSFPAFAESVWPGRGVKARRNSAVTTIAPTGYTSIVANCSSGIEPYFALAYRRENSMGGVDQFEVNELFAKMAKTRGFYTAELMNRVIEEGSVAKINEVPADVKKIFVTAYDISPEWHVKIQAAFQKHTDNAVSKTINFPESATPTDIGRVYELAYELGCKGVTVFRDNSKNVQVLKVGRGKEEQSQTESQALVDLATAQKALARPAPRSRPQMIHGSTYKIKTGYGDLFVTINHDEHGEPFEVFATIGKTGGVFAAKSEAICRLISLALRSGVEPTVIVKQLKGIRGPMPTWGKKGMVLSIPDAIAQVMEEHLRENQPELDLKYQDQSQSMSAKEATKSTKEEALADDSLAMSEDLATVESTVASATATVTVKESSATHKQSVKELTVTQAPTIADYGVAPTCPDCYNILEFGEGCLLCRACGYSKCG